MADKPTNAEIRARRREAALKAAATRRQSAEETARKGQDREAKRLANLRAVIQLAQEIRRESDLYYHAHHQRWAFSSGRWTPEQIESAHQFLMKFRDPKTGAWQHRPMTRRGRTRL